MDHFDGVCTYHPNCLEGLASGPSIEKRWGKRGVELRESKEVWELEAYYIAQAIVNYTMILSPQRIVLGGGVMNQEQLFPLIREKVQEFINGYLKTKQLIDMEHYIVPSCLEGNQGIMGCIQLAKVELGM